jgi:uncharacterized protein (DUF952 family)
MLVYKILRSEEWAAFDAAGETAGAPVDLADGYIHLSTAAQAAETAARHFAGAGGLWLLAVETEEIGDLQVGTLAGRAALPASLRRRSGASTSPGRGPCRSGNNGHVFPEEIA